MKEQKIVSFKFKEMLLSEARSAIIVGDGNYSDIKAALMDELPRFEAFNETAPDYKQKTYAFGLPTGKDVHEEQRRGLCLAITGMFKKAEMSWGITYSSSKKLFICYPKSKSKLEPKKVGYRKKMSPPPNASGN